MFLFSPLLHLTVISSVWLMLMQLSRNHGILLVTLFVHLLLQSMVLTLPSKLMTKLLQVNMRSDDKVAFKIPLVEDRIAKDSVPESKSGDNYKIG